MKQKFIIFGKFAAVGGINTCIDFIVYTLLAVLSVNYLFAQCISYICGLLNSYFMNRTWTFKRKEKANWQEFVRFVCVNGLTLLITMFFLHLFYAENHWSLAASKFAVTIIGVFINFIGAKLFVFNKKASDA
ncbi:GtrA family protein [Niallia nealsonii]|uniref:Sugar translocase n=1 Tax=Niallia nealsonii TaxID=115979 RepID=A0A2N0YX36_9BACI|nr:GtrA family protein [Niallia nealsonii]PKG21821.1 sugar translocase [Niallia nealsonii]